MPQKKVSATIHVTAVIDGQDGTSPWIADLSNEMDSVACDLNGKPTAAKSLTTTIALFYGQTAKSFGTPTVKRNGTAVTVNASSYANGVKVSYSNKVLTVAYSTSAVISGTDEYEITITASDDPSVVRTLTFSVLGARPGATGEAATTYQLVPSASEIVRRKDGSYSPASLTCYCTSLKDGTATDNPSGATMQYSYDGSSWTAFSSSTSFAASDIYAQPSKKLYLRLLVDGKVMDKETVPVVEEGQDGVTYRIAVNPESITIPSDSASVTVNKISGNFFYRKGDGEEQQLITNFVLWRKDIDGTYTPIMNHANVGGFEYNSPMEISETVAALVVCLQHTLTNDPNIYYARVEIPVRKNGDTGQRGENAPYDVTDYARYDSREMQSRYRIPAGHIDPRTDDATVYDGGWSLRAPAPTSAYPYIWQRTRRYSSSDSLTATSYICLTGAPGTRGDTGRMYYMAGQWATGKTYTCDGRLCPVVYHVDGFWFMENEGSSTGDEPSDSSTVWDKLAGFDMVITNAVFVEEFAKMGTFVIARDWMISTQGKVYSNYGTVDDSVPAYTYFDPIFADGPIRIFDENHTYMNAGTNTKALATGMAMKAGQTYRFVLDGYTFNDSHSVVAELVREDTSEVVATLTRTGTRSSSVAMSDVTIAADATYRMQVRGVGSSSMMYRVSKLSVIATFPTFTPNYAVDGLTGETYQNNTHIRGEIYTEKLIATDGSVSIEITPGSTVWTCKKWPLSRIAIGADDNGLYMRMYDNDGKLVWDLGKNGDGKVTHTWGEVKLKQVSGSTPSREEYINVGYNDDGVQTYYIFDGTLYTSSSTASQTVTGYFIRPNNGVFPVDMDTGQSQINVLHYVSGVLRDTNPIYFVP